MKGVKQPNEARHLSTKKTTYASRLLHLTVQKFLYEDDQMLQEHRSSFFRKKHLILSCKLCSKSKCMIFLAVCKRSRNSIGLAFEKFASIFCTDFFLF